MQKFGYGPVLLEELLEFGVYNEQELQDYNHIFSVTLPICL